MSTNERERLAALLIEHLDARDWYDGTGSTERFVEAVRLADVLLADGWTKAPTITAEDIADRLFDRAQTFHELSGHPQAFISWGPPPSDSGDADD
jgi:hypothetical protein